MNATATLFDAGEIIARPRREAARVKAEVADEDVTGVAGVALWGPLLDRLNLVDVADARRLRPIGPGGYTGGECYRTVVEVLLAGGEFLSDRSLLEGATEQLRGQHAFPSHTTLYRFLAGADLGRAQKAAAVNRTMLERAWALGAGPQGGVVTIDPDATLVDTYGPNKEGSTFTYRGEVGLSPLIGVCGETGDVLALRARGGNAHPGRANGGFIRECVAAIPAAVRAEKNLWVRIDSAGYQHDVFATCEQLGAAFTITAPNKSNVRAAVLALASDPATRWVPALNVEGERGSEIAETTIEIGWRKKDRRLLRLIVRRQRTSAGDQLSFDDLDGWRFHAIVTNLPPLFAPADMVEAHHRLRGGIPEDTIRQLKEDFGLIHAPVQNFFGNWLWLDALLGFFYRLPSLPKLVGPHVLRQSLIDGVAKGLFGLASGSAWDAEDAVLRFAQPLDPSEVQFQPGTWLVRASAIKELIAQRTPAGETASVGEKHGISATPTPVPSTTDVGTDEGAVPPVASSPSALSQVRIRLAGVPASKARDVVKVAVLPLSASSSDVRLDLTITADGGLAGIPPETLNLVVLEGLRQLGLEAEVTTDEGADSNR